MVSSQEPAAQASSTAATVVAPRNGMGLAAAILGIIGLFTSVLGSIIIPLLFWAPSILAIVFGVIGMRRAGRGEATNRSMALAGLVLGIVGIVIGVLFLVLLLGALSRSQ